MHPKKLLPKKPIFWGQIFNWKNSFLAKTFFGCKVICTFLKSVRKDGFFDAPFDLFKEKKFSSLRRNNELFWEPRKVKNGRNRSKIRKTIFYKQIIFTALPKFYATHRIYEILSQSLVPAIEGNCLVKKSAKSFSSKQLYHLLI